MDDLEKRKSPTKIRTPGRPARNNDYTKQPGAKDMYHQQLQHFTHTMCSRIYNNSHNKYTLYV